MCQPCNFVQLVIAGKAKGELDKANKESTSKEEGSRGLVGTWKDENCREITRGEIRARGWTERRERSLEEENEELKRFYLIVIEKQTFTSCSIIIRWNDCTHRIQHPRKHR